jgi:hypothetical protein
MSELTLAKLQEAIDLIPGYHRERYPMQFVETNDETKLIMCSDGTPYIDEENKLQIIYVPLGYMKRLQDILNVPPTFMKADKIMDIPIFYPEYEE